MLELKLVADGRIVGLDAVDEHEHLVGLRAAHAHLRLCAERARAAHRETRHGAQQVADEDGLAALDLLTRDDGHGAARRLEAHGRA